MQADDILHFWFEELSPEQHFAQEDAIDAMIRVRFGATLQAARQCELWGWRSTPQGRLAEILVLDQFSRNIHRGSPLAFAQDAQALTLAQELVAGRHDQAMVLFDQPGLENNLKFEVAHRDIIARFGRYPHRNAVLGRTSTAQELAFLAQPGSSF